MRSAASFLLLGSAALALALTTPVSARKAQPEADRFGPTADYPIIIGDPYMAGGTSFTPSDTLNYDAVGYAIAGEGAGVTAAHHTLPIPSYVEVTALDSGKTALVRLDRRGPMDNAALIQLAPAALAQLGLDPGTAHAAVRVRRVNPPEQERALLRTGQQAPARMDTPPGLLTALKRKLGIVPTQPIDEKATALLSSPPPRLPVVTARPAPRPPLPATPPPKPAGQGSLKPEAKPAPASAPVPVATAAVPAPAPSPAPTPAAPFLQKPPAALAKPATAHSQVVQVGAFSARERADAVAKALGGNVTSVGKVFRVRLPAATKAEADAALAKAHRAGYADARILSGD